MIRPQVIRPFLPDEDTAAVFYLWQASLEDSWPLTAELLRGVLTQFPCQNGDHFVALHAGQVIGFVATQVARHGGTAVGNGGIALILVHPDVQRQGMGRVLHETALDHLRRVGVRRAQLAGASSSRLWPGIPANLPDALAFFQACGWEYSETS